MQCVCACVCCSSGDEDYQCNVCVHVCVAAAGMRTTNAVCVCACVCCSSKLEADVKRLKSELQSSRCLEQELRSQIASLSFSDRTTKSELYQLRQENDSLQSKCVASQLRWHAVCRLHV